MAQPFWDGELYDRRQEAAYMARRWILCLDGDARGMPWRFNFGALGTLVFERGRCYWLEPELEVDATEWNVAKGV